ncbi:hypothetical protein ASF17_09310 [Frigoribacterium sp. Leaf263]|uniref:hypothetical protein n=1 Tax=Frigoribacterium sp. Leaf263 TaxID=1736313 RepID=UPI0006F23CC4|nr:hypothetical protein [Frigoribacterium sp. Leaf263]KQO81393.1 hypothetical protein ASF17_09310 [Frigoribacterium sp. Leaf263]
MMGTTTRLWQGFIGGAAAVMLLAGCTAGGAGDGGSAGPTPTGGGDSSPSADPSSSSTPSSDAGGASAEPVTEVGLDCAGLLDSATVSAVQGEWVSQDYYARADAEPSDYAVAQEGGIVCTWNNGRASDGKNNPIPRSGYTGLLVQVLPHADEQYAQLVATYDGDPGLDCFGNMSVENQSLAGCTFDTLIDGTWVSLLATGLDVPEGSTSEKAIDPIVREITDAVTAADVSDEPWPLGGALPNWTCDVDQPYDAAALGLDGETRIELAGGGYSVYAAAWQRAQASNCFTALDGAGAPQTSIIEESALVGGAWALDQRLAFGHVDPASEVEVTGLAEGDRAYRTCAETCITDLVLGDDWVRLSVNPVAIPDVEATSVALTEQYVARAAA